MIVFIYNISHAAPLIPSAIPSKTRAADFIGKFRKIKNSFYHRLSAEVSRALHSGLRSMARATGHAPLNIHCAWKAFGLQSRWSETYKSSSDTLIVDKVRVIGSLYQLRFSSIGNSAKKLEFSTILLLHEQPEEPHIRLLPALRL